MIVIDTSEYRVMPWKNGGGSTTEIAISPPGSTLDTFDWRVSMATVGEPGPFSAFPGIDRTLSVLQGNGIRLDIDGKPVTLVRGSPPLPFAADIPVYGTPIDGGIVDLNVMTRRGRYRHEVLHLTGETRLMAASSGATALLLAVTAMRIAEDGKATTLPAGATARLERPAAGQFEITADGPIELFLIDLFAL